MPTTVATDSFTYSNGELSAVSGGVWVSVLGGINVSDSEILPTYASGLPVNWSSYYRGGISWPDDQWAQIDRTVLATNGYMGPSVRVSETGSYNYIVKSDHRGIYKIVGDTATELGSVLIATGAVTAKLEIVGTTLFPYIDGVLDSDSGSQTDASLSSGSAGIVGWGTYTADRSDNWEGGDMTEPPSEPPSEPTFQRLILSFDNKLVELKVN